MLRRLPSLALLLACACTQPAPVGGPTPERASFDARCDAERAWLACAEAAEAGIIAPVSRSVERRGDSLVIRSGEPEPAVLVSDAGEGDAYVRYVYGGFAPALRQHLVGYVMREGGGFLLVDAASGRMTDLPGRPVLSPLRTRFVVTSGDLWEGYDRNVLQVWRFTDELPVLEWGLDGGGAWGASDPVWLGEAALEFVRHEVGGTGEAERSARYRLRVTADGLDVRRVAGSSR